MSTKGGPGPPQNPPGSELHGVVTHDPGRDRGHGGVPENQPRKRAPRRTRAYSKSGVNALRRLTQTDAHWLDTLGEVGEVLRLWRAALIADLGGVDNLSTQQRAIVE